MSVLCDTCENGHKFLDHLRWIKWVWKTLRKCSNIRSEIVSTDIPLFHFRFQFFFWFQIWTRCTFPSPNQRSFFSISPSANQTIASCICKIKLDAEIQLNLNCLPCQFTNTARRVLTACLTLMFSTLFYTLVSPSDLSDKIVDRERERINSGFEDSIDDSIDSSVDSTVDSGETEADDFISTSKKRVDFKATSKNSSSSKKTNKPSSKKVCRNGSKNDSKSSSESKTTDSDAKCHYPDITNFIHPMVTTDFAFHVMLISHFLPFPLRGIKKSHNFHKVKFLASIKFRGGIRAKAESALTMNFILP